MARLRLVRNQLVFLVGTETSREQVLAIQIQKENWPSYAIVVKEDEDGPRFKRTVRLCADAAPFIVVSVLTFQDSASYKLLAKAYGYDFSVAD